MRPRFRVGIRVLLALIVACSLVFEGVRRWMHNPASARFPAGSIAVLNTEEQGFLAVYPVQISQRTVKYDAVPFGSLVEIISDSLPSDFKVQPGEHAPRGADRREVAVKVLTGKKAGVIGAVERYYLRPVP